MRNKSSLCAAGLLAGAFLMALSVQAEAGSRTRIHHGFAGGRHHRGGIAYARLGYRPGLGYGTEQGIAALPPGYAFGPAPTLRTYVVPTTVYHPVTQAYTVPVRGYRTVEQTHYVAVTTYRPVTTAVQVPYTSYQTYQQTVQVPTTVYQQVHRACNCGG